MWGLAYKDLLLMRRSLWYYAFLLVIFTVFVLIGSLDAYILSGMAMLFSYMVPLSSFSLDEAARWGEFAAATPACLRGIVDGKYLCSLLTAAGGGGAAAGGRGPGRRLGPGRRSLPKNRPILLPRLPPTTYSKIPKIKNAFHWLMKWQALKTAE